MAVVEEDIAPQTNTAERYSAVKGSHLSDEDAATIGTHLRKLAKQQHTDIATLAVEDIVQDAKRRSSPLHRFYTWNKDEAFEEYLKERTRYLVRSIRVEIVYQQRNEKTRFRVPGMVSIQVGSTYNERVYATPETVLSNPSLLAQKRQDALRKLLYWREQFLMYRNLEEFADMAPIFAAIEELET